MYSVLTMHKQNIWPMEYTSRNFLCTQNYILRSWNTLRTQSDIRVSMISMFVVDSEHGHNLMHLHTRLLQETSKCCVLQPEVSPFIHNRINLLIIKTISTDKIIDFLPPNHILTEGKFFQHLFLLLSSQRVSADLFLQKCWNHH